MSSRHTKKAQSVINSDLTREELYEKAYQMGIKSVSDAQRARRRRVGHNCMGRKRSKPLRR